MKKWQKHQISGGHENRLQNNAKSNNTIEKCHDSTQAEQKKNHIGNKNKIRLTGILVTFSLIVLFVISIFIVLHPSHSKGVTIVFDCNAPASQVNYEPASQFVVKGEKVTCPPFPVRRDFKFDGWYTDKSCSSPYDFHTVPRKDMSLYAKWIDAKSEEAQLTEEDWNIFADSVDSINSLTKAFIAENGFVPVENRKQAIAQIEELAQELLSSGILTYVSSDENTVYIEFASGLTFAKHFSAPDESSKGSSTIITTGVEPFAYNMDTGYILSWSPETIWTPLTSYLARDISLFIPSRDHKSKIARNEAATFQNLKDLGTSDILLWDGHGLYLDKYGPTLLTSEFLGDTDLEASLNTIKLELMNLAPIGEWTTASTDDGSYFIAITPEFIKDYFTLNHGLVYLSTCESGHNDDDRLADAFIEAGADAVFYNNGSDPIKTWYTEAMMHNVLYYMAGAGPYLKDNTITDEADGIYHTAAEALSLSKEYMKIFCINNSVDYRDSSFEVRDMDTYYDEKTDERRIIYDSKENIIENTYVRYYNTQAAISKNSDSEYTICSGIKGHLYSSDHSIDVSKIELELVGSDTYPVSVFEDGNFYFNDVSVNKEDNNFLPKVTNQNGAPYQLKILYNGAPFLVIDNIYVQNHHFTNLGSIDLSDICRVSVTIIGIPDTSLSEVDISLANETQSYCPLPTSSKNTYQSYVSKGDYELTVSIPGYDQFKQTVSVDEETSLECKPNPSGIIAGTIVRSDNGQPVNSASLSIRSNDGSSVFETTSDQSGKYSFSNVMPGTYTLVCSKKSYEKAELSVVLDPDNAMVVSQDFRLNYISVGNKVMGLFKGSLSKLAGFIGGLIALIVVAFAIVSSFGGSRTGKSDKPFMYLLMMGLLKIICVLAVIFMLYLLVSGQL